ncbi:M48 family metallopeptidase [Thermoproteota archaeon]
MEEIKIIRSKRRSLTLEIKSDASVIVRAPKFASTQFIEKVLTQKRNWIRKKQEQIRAQLEANPVKGFTAGEEILFFGTHYRIITVDNLTPTLIFNNHSFLLNTEHEGSKAKKLFEKWYRDQAVKWITNRVTFLADQFGFKYSSVKINSAKSRWGSCSIKGSLNFSWRLMMAPVEIIDYVIIHELCHLKEHNHSSLFWKLVQQYCPNYKLYRSQLKNYSKLFQLS